MRIFMYKGTLLGLTGTIIGTVLGYAFCWAQQTFELVAIPGEIYFISVLPIEIRPLEFLLIAAISVAISFLATLYPSRRAAGLYPVDILRLG
jgi:lipoprotein-releasing system permease protein